MGDPHVAGGCFNHEAASHLILCPPLLATYYPHAHFRILIVNYTYISVQSRHIYTAVALFCGGAKLIQLFAP